MKKDITIIKVGGKIIEDDFTLKQLVNQFAKIKGAKVLVHGGGRTATKIAKQLGVETTMINGRRVTDAKMLDVVTMVYGGLVNKQIVALLQSNGVNALGVTGADADLIRAHKRKVVDVDYGFVGDVDSVNLKQIREFVDKQIVPVIAPLTHDGNGSLLNTNADTIAGSCANAMAKEYDVVLYYCFEFDGVLSNTEDNTSIISHITKTSYSQLKSEGVVKEGMIPKLDNAFESLEQGVKKVIITSIRNIGDKTKGTHITL